jgi:glycosyltransferase involved in cell wall biosynthesis
VREKGFDIVIEAAKEFLSNQMRKGLLEIYGSGPLKADLLMELSRFPGFFDASQGGVITPGAQVVYFGQVNGTRVTEALNRAHYLLMPSRFLETFGLSALEAIESGVPVIGFDQGGLRQFLLTEHRVPAGKGSRENFLDTVRNTDGIFSGANWRRQSLSVMDVAKRFGKAQWMEGVRKELGPKIHKILVISDYSAPIGGIETHIRGSLDVLRDAGYEVETLFGMEGNIRSIRYLGLLFSWANAAFAFRLWAKLRKFRPDAVWIHSEVRCIGPVGLLPLKRYSGEIVKTYHDLGYF